MEQGTGIEPAFTAWEAVVLPIYEPCVARIIANPLDFCKGILSQRVNPLSKNPKSRKKVVEFPAGM